MNRTRLRTGPLAAGAALAVAALAVLIVSRPASATAAPRAPALRAADVQMRVVDVTPTAPSPSTTKRPLTVTPRPDQHDRPRACTACVVTGERGDPIGTQRALDDAIGHDTPPGPGQRRSPPPAR